MLKFEFVQPNEFLNPYYMIFNEGENTGVLRYNNGQWGLDWIYCWHNAKDMMRISSKAEELNQSTRAQRILGVF